jgi:hypothetical protein
MTFGKEKKARAASDNALQQNQNFGMDRLNQSMAISQPKGFNIGGLGGAYAGIDAQGTPQVTGRMPFGDENLTLANRNIQQLLQGFGSDLSQNNAITDSLNKLMGREQDSQLKKMFDNLNAKGQLGGSLQNKAMKDLSEVFADQQLKTGLAGFDATLQALQALRNESGANLAQQLQPIQLAMQGMQANNALNLQRAGLPMQLAQLMSPAFQQAGQTNAQIEMQRKSDFETAWDFYQKQQQQFAKMAGTAVGAAMGNPMAGAGGVQTAGVSAAGFGG